MKNIYRIQAYDWIMCGYFCFEFIDFKLKSKSLLESTKLFSPNDYEKNTKIILEYIWRRRKTIVFSITCSKCKNEDEKLFKQ